MDVRRKQLHSKSPDPIAENLASTLVKRTHKNPRLVLKRVNEWLPSALRRLTTGRFTFLYLSVNNDSSLLAHSSRHMYYKMSNVGGKIVGLDVMQRAQNFTEYDTESD